MAWAQVQPCEICGWQYDEQRERDGVYRRVAPLFFYPHNVTVCRWCIRRPTVSNAIDNARRRIDLIRASWVTEDIQSEKNA